MKTFKKYPSTLQYSGVVKHVRDHCKYHNLPLPKLKFTGSVKLHGTNFSIGMNPEGEIWFQSRERMISFESDNAGSAAFGEQNAEQFKEIYKIICEEYPVDHDAFYITGEWFGQGINKGVSINQIQEKKFGIFEIIFVKNSEPDNTDILQVDPKNFHLKINTLIPRAFVIDYVVPPVEVTIDFARPDLVQNFLLEETLKVEEVCPIGKYFGVTDGCTIGEGLVYSTDEMDLPKFKIKGEKHVSCKVTTLKELSAAEIASKENAGAFVEYACTENRLNQGIAKLGEMGLDVDIKNMGAFLKFIGTDVLNEEKDVIINSKLERKDIMPKIADKARNWFIHYIDQTLDLV